MSQILTMPDRTDEHLVRLGDRTVSSNAAQLHIFGVLLGAHLGDVGYVSAADIATLPPQFRTEVDELLDTGIWSRNGSGYTISHEYAMRTMRESLERLNDPALCVATGSRHVRGDSDSCRRCGATLV